MSSDDAEKPDMVLDLVTIVQDLAYAANTLTRALQAQKGDLTEITDYDKFGVQVSYHVQRALQTAADLKEFADNVHNWTLKAHANLKLQRFKDEQH